jgi:hypothetical protein
MEKGWCNFPTTRILSDNCDKIKWTARGVEEMNNASLAAICSRSKYGSQSTG